MPDSPGRSARIPVSTESPIAVPRPHPTLLLRGVLLCSDSTPQRVVRVDPKTGICPKHNNGACALWYVPWPDAERAAEADEQLRADLEAVREAEREALRRG